MMRMRVNGLKLGSRGKGKSWLTSLIMVNDEVGKENYIIRVL